MKKNFIAFMIAFSAFTYSQERSSSMLQKVVGKWQGLDSAHLTIFISEPDTNSDIYIIEILNINNLGRTGTFEGTVIYTDQKSSLADNGGKNIGFFNENYFLNCNNKLN